MSLNTENGDSFQIYRPQTVQITYDDVETFIEDPDNDHLQPPPAKRPRRHQENTSDIDAQSSSSSSSSSSNTPSFSSFYFSASDQVSLEGVEHEEEEEEEEHHHQQHSEDNELELRVRQIEAYGGRLDQEAEQDTMGAGDAAPMPNGAAAPATTSLLQFNRNAQIKCLLCWESQQFLALHQRSSFEQDTTNGQSRVAAARNAMVRTVQDFHGQIFEFEQMLCGLQNDEQIFRSMLTLRRRLVEDYLRQQHIDFEPWTLDMLREHYDVCNEHGFHPQRELAWDLNILRRLAQQLATHDVLCLDPDSGQSRVNTRAADLLLKTMRSKAEVCKSMREGFQRSDIRRFTAMRRLTAEVARLNATSGANGRLTAECSTPAQLTQHREAQVLATAAQRATAGQSTGVAANEHGDEAQQPDLRYASSF